MSLLVEMQSLDSKLETEPKAQHDPQADWSRTLLMMVHCGHCWMASKEAGASTIVASGYTGSSWYSASPGRKKTR